VPDRQWDSVLIDYPLAQKMIASGDAEKLSAEKRIVLIRPSERHELPALKAAGFTGYLVKPVRAASLAAQLGGETKFEDPRVELTADSGEIVPAGKGLSILVAEDNEINALLVRSLLVRLGHRPTVTTDGAAAVDAWNAARADGAPYDLILMDVQMPGMDGLEATRRIRAAEGDGPAASIVALTANAYAEDREACLAAGMDGLLVKPLDREKLREVLEAAMRRTPLAA
jgi:CheY-like chemotaxis protein